MTATALPKHESLRGKTQTNGILNGTHIHGAHNPFTEQNDSNYNLGLLQYVYTMKIRTSLIMGPYTDCHNYHVILIRH